MVKILNLYAGIGGNRKLWGNDHEVTAVELRPEIAAVYQDFFPNDNIVIGDAHQYLLDHYREFDFIWSSPPCQTHSRIRAVGVWNKSFPAAYLDMKLWQEIIFLSKFACCDWVIENVFPYYKPFIQPAFSIQRHHFWSNKFILASEFESDQIKKLSASKLMRKYGFDITRYSLNGLDKRQILRNCVNPELGLYVFNQITGVNK